MGQSPRWGVRGLKLKAPYHLKIRQYSQKFGGAKSVVLGVG